MLQNEALVEHVVQLGSHMFPTTCHEQPCDFPEAMNMIQKVVHTYSIH